jgi:hypothetical protein
MEERGGHARNLGWGGGAMRVEAYLACYAAHLFNSLLNARFAQVFPHLNALKIFTFCGRINYGIVVGFAHSAIFKSRHSVPSYLP